MSHSQIQTENRELPLNQPNNWQVKYPRYMVELPEDVNDISITYIGIQPRHEENPAKGIHTELHAHVTSAVQRKVAAKFEDWIQQGSGELAPILWEKMYVEAGYDLPDTEVYICYWTDKNAAVAATKSLNLQQLYKSLSPSEQEVVALWRESLSVPKPRIETVYSGNDYQPGIASLPGAAQVGHKFTGYWGAARDRLPASSHDPLEPEYKLGTPNFEKDTKGRVIEGENKVSVAHIRSGQFWARCDDDEREAYESTLEPILREGMAFLEENAEETGDIGLRFSRHMVTNRLLQAEEAETMAALNGNGNGLSNGLVNLMKSYTGYFNATNGTNGINGINGKHGTNGHSSNGDSHISDADKFGLAVTKDRPRFETCSSGFLRSLKDIEAWAAKHKTHHKIFHGAHAHSTKFGKTTFKFRTWHEMSTLKPGEVTFEYINCHPRTGLIPFFDV
ncbi:heme-dehydratase domain-containing protein [Trichoderma sp. SZMC 28014]